MKRVLFVAILMMVLCNAKAQISEESESPAYDLKINGIYYNVISLEELTLCAVDRVDPTTTTLKIPATVNYGGRVFSVPRVDFATSCTNVRTLILPINLDYLNIDGCDAEDLHLSAKIIKGFSHCPRLKRLSISSNTEEMHMTFSNCDLDELVFEDGNTILSPIRYVFMDSNIDSCYCGRNFAEIGNYNSSYFIMNGFRCSINSIYYGPSVTRVENYMTYGVKYLDIPENVVEIYEENNGNHPQLEEINILSKNVHFVNSQGINSMLSNSPRLKKVYINTRENYGFIDRMECQEFVIGHDITSLSGTNISVAGFVKVLNRNPPLAPQFTNETYLHTPLFVPRGSLNDYQTANGWRNFFNMIEFDWEEPAYEISVSSNILEYGYVEGSGTYYYGDSATVTATPNFGYEFKYWAESGAIVSTTNTYSFYVDRNRSLTAVFDIPSNLISIYAISNNVEYGIVEGTGDYPYGSTVTLKAIPTPGNSFSHWLENGYFLAFGDTYSLVANSDRTITAVFKRGLGVDENEQLDMIVYSVGRTIHVEGVGDLSKVVVYNSHGQLVYKGIDKTVAVTCSGLYIVAVGNRRIKVIVE